HLPTGTVIKCQATRSRSQNRSLARKLLAEKLEDAQKGDKSRSAIKAEVKRKKKASKKKKANRKYRALDDAKEEEEEEEEVDSEGVENGDRTDGGGGLGEGKSAC
ncbi:MAG: hypothetical protein Q9190_004392, partial [Brigantiaea leucoxantha]